MPPNASTTLPSMIQCSEMPDMARRDSARSRTNLGGGVGGGGGSRQKLKVTEGSMRGIGTPDLKHGRPTLRTWKKGEGPDLKNGKKNKMK